MQPSIPMLIKWVSPILPSLLTSFMDDPSCNHWSHPVSLCPQTSFGYWLFLMLLPSINYLVFPAVQALTSEDLRARLAPAKNRPKGCPTYNVCMMRGLKNDTRSHAQMMSANFSLLWTLPHCQYQIHAISLPLATIRVTTLLPPHRCRHLCMAPLQTNNA